MIQPTQSKPTDTPTVNTSAIHQLTQIFNLTISPTLSPQRKQTHCFHAVLNAIQRKRWEKIQKAIKFLPTLRNIKNRTLFQASIERGYVDQIKHIRKNLSSLISKYPLHAAARSGETEFLSLFDTANINEKDQEGKTPLMIAIEHGQDVFVRTLIKKGALQTPYKLPNSLTMTPIAYAVFLEKVSCIDALLHQKSLNIQIEKVGNLLHLAIQFGREEALRHLLTSPKINQMTQKLLLEGENHLGQTPLNLAASMGNLVAIALLHNKGASLKTKDHKGKTPIDLATPEAKQLLISLQKNTPYQTQLPIHNLVFEEKISPAHVGMLEVLQQKGVLKGVKRCAGSSMGALSALLLALGYRKVLNPKSIEQCLKEKTGNPNCTFGELNALISQGKPFKHLHIFTDKWISSEDLTNKDVSIASSVKAAMQAPQKETINAFDSKENIPIFNKATLGFKVSSSRTSYSRRRIQLAHEPNLSKETLIRRGRRAAHTFIQNGLDLITFSLDFERKDQSIIELNYTDPNYVERIEPMKKIKSAFFAKPWKPQNPTIVHSLCGPGGIGKSELACAFGNANRSRFSLIYWIDAGTNVTRINAYRHLADLLHIPLTGKEPPEEVRRALFNRLENHDFTKPWLLIFDNVEEKLDFPKKGGCILTTSRRKDLWKQLNPVEPFQMREAVALIRKVTESTHETQMKELAKELSYFPLALAKAAAYIAECGITIGEYLEEYRKIPKYSLKDKGQPRDRYYLSLKATWAITFKQLQKEDPNAFSWLSHCCFFYAEGIPEKWTDIWLNEQRSHTKSNDLLKLLRNYSVIKHNSRAKTFSLHRLIQQIIEVSLTNKKTSYLKAFCFLEKRGEPFDSGDLNNEMEKWNAGKQWLPHGNWMTHHLKELAKQSPLPTLASLYRQLGMVKQSITLNFLESLSDFRESLRLHQKVFNKKPHPDVASSLNNVGYALKSLGRSTKALRYYRQALAMFKAVHGKEPHPSVAGSLNNVGLALQSLGRSTEALQYCKQALVMERAVHGKDPHPSVARGLNNVGLALQSLGRSTKALQYYKQALAMKKAVHGKDPHPDVALSLNNVGLALQSLGRYTKALRYYRQALAMFKAVHGKEPHPSVAGSLNSVGSALKSLGRSTEALQYYKQALAMFKAVHGKDPHPDVARGLNNVGSALKSLGRYTKALRYYKQALAMFKAVHGKEPHPSVAGSLNNVGSALDSLGRYSEAVSYLKQAYQMALKIYNSITHPHVVLFSNNLKAIQGKLDLSNRNLSQDSSNTKKIYELCDQALIYQTSGHYKEALSCYNQALEIYQTKTTQDQQNVKGIQEKIVFCQCMQGLLTVIKHMQSQIGKKS